MKIVIDDFGGFLPMLFDYYILSDLISVCVLFYGLVCVKSFYNIIVQVVFDTALYTELSLS